MIYIAALCDPSLQSRATILPLFIGPYACCHITARYQVILLGEQRHIRCEQLAQGCCPNCAAVGVEPATSRSRVQRSNHYTTESPRGETVGRNIMMPSADVLVRLLITPRQCRCRQHVVWSVLVRIRPCCSVFWWFCVQCDSAGETWNAIIDVVTHYRGV